MRAFAAVFTREIFERRFAFVVAFVVSFTVTFTFTVSFFGLFLFVRFLLIFVFILRTISIFAIFSIFYFSNL